MAISLNNHETRIKTLESNSSTSSWAKGVSGTLHWTKESSTGLTIQWGMANTASGWTTRTVTFPKAFANTNYFFTPAVVSGGSGSGQYNSFRVWNRSTTGCAFNVGCDEQISVMWLAIGYLISDRILNYIYIAIFVHIFLIFSRFFTELNKEV